MDPHLDLIAKVSHDLRTPLASLQGYLELLLLRHGQLDPAQARDHLHTAVRQSERVSRLVNDLFEWARLEAGQTRTELEDFPIAELLHDVAQRFRADAQLRKVQLQVLPLATPGPAPQTLVRADVALVERVLGALVENALRHTPASGSVTLSYTGAGSFAQVEVHDTGSGIDAAELERIFKHYEHAERVAHDFSDGQGGLGLAIARLIVQLHGGEMRVHSEPAQGTRVSFDLPLATGTAASGAAPQAVPLPAPCRTAPRAPLADAEQLRSANATLNAVATGTSGVFGAEFFAAMVQHFARALDVDCAFVTECADQPPTRLRTLAFWTRQTGYRDNFEYALQDTPCEAVVQNAQDRFIPQGVGSLFPKERGFEAYLGLPIVASNGRILGHMALLNAKPRGDELLIDSVYRIFLARAASEIERLQALAQLAFAHGALGVPPSD